MAESKQDRELIELLNELRVVLPGVQVLFAFLLTVPFAQGWTKVTGSEKAVFFTAFVCMAIATALLIAPSAYHRIRWREKDKEAMLVYSNRLAIAGIFFLAIAMTCVVYFLTDHLYTGLAPWVTAGVAGLFTWFWFGLPIMRHIQDSDN
ncbi:MAG: hypothetical protein QOG54_1833 [Actinomycetota bacterium]|jgi:hypothetical protein|nr:hypothetical protein [Actinomycetota bacterium]